MRGAVRGTYAPLTEGKTMTKSAAAVAELDRMVALFSNPVVAPKPAPAPVGRRSAFDESAVVEVLVGANPKRAGGVSRLRFDLYRTGMTVGEYLDACFAFEAKAPYARKRFRYLADIKWDSDRNFIRLYPAGTVLTPPASAE